ncbi:hypothetical protein ACFSTE_16420 [Aquimarina hainanensis]|uniref:Uncharacterized protein n=1 Tax=Aquimarina hainanensis TaxID=1578017 RepID=A0ABW5NC59_9FLAO|nr:hypothetical protein [Aquimarina sp. TRL1]
MKTHTFHIPVMGIGFTIDTPLKVAPLGIDSAISLVDDILIEKLRKMYCSKFEIPYKEITDKIDDFRAKRITSYLNLIHKLAEEKFEKIKNATFETTKEIKEYIQMLPDSSEIKKEFNQLTHQYFSQADIKTWFKEHLSLGSIDVNIMTKVDKDNYNKKEKLPTAYNDAHAALRGYANSTLHSSLILSAGMNPRLYSYIENFEDFYPDKNGVLKKKLVLKVSDYRSALIQGRFLAKKGLWVSEYRIESGLNCGGHAFATDGYLMGPILEQFKEKREALIQTVYQTLVPALEQKGFSPPQKPFAVKITAQGGVGTSEEHHFILDHYQVDSVGWGSPFLLVPESTTVDEKTMNQLAAAREKDLYLSDISPLGVPFNNLKGNTKDEEKENNIKKGRPGSSCPKKFVALNKEHNDKGLCTASRQYQYLKIKELQGARLSEQTYQKELAKITEKSCTCVGLGTSALLKYNLDTKKEGTGVSVCPGPNMAYFSKVMKLREMTDHIYGRDNMISRTDRPNLFIKELGIYINYLKKTFDNSKHQMDQKQQKYLCTFSNNLKEGISYYQALFTNIESYFTSSKKEILKALEENQKKLQKILIDITNTSATS